MRKGLIALLLTVVFAVPAFAQMHKEGMKGHMEHHGQMDCECCGQMMGECGSDMMHHKMGHGDMDKMEHMMGMCLEHAAQLGLTADQTAKLKVIHREMEKKAIRLQADKKIAKMELMEIMEVKDFDLEKANAAVQKIADLEKGQHQEMLKSMKQVRGMITDDQFQKMKEMMPMMMEGKMGGQGQCDMSMHKQHHGQ